jgi:hypothetical protein
MRNPTESQPALRRALRYTALSCLAAGLFMACFSNPTPHPAVDAWPAESDARGSTDDLDGIPPAGADASFGGDASEGASPCGPADAADGEVAAGDAGLDGGDAPRPLGDSCWPGDDGDDDDDEDPEEEGADEQEADEPSEGEPRDGRPGSAGAGRGATP